jgi:hypothetical protein
MKSSRAISRSLMMMMITDMVLETSVQYRHLTQLIVREDFIEFSRLESSRTNKIAMFRTRTHKLAQLYSDTFMRVLCHCFVSPIIPVSSLIWLISEPNRFL